MLYVSVWIHIRVCVSMFSLLFFFLVAIMDFSSMNSAPVHCSRDLKNSLFSNFFIKNRSHGTIYTFKNYFAIVFSVFSKNKLYPNGPSLSLSMVVFFLQSHDVERLVCFLIAYHRHGSFCVEIKVSRL